LQRVPIQSLNNNNNYNNNTESAGSFHENQSNHLEEMQDEPMDRMVVEDLEVTSALSASKESSDEDEDVDADIDEEISLDSAKPGKCKKVCIWKFQISVFK